ncbi:MAG: N-acetyl-gamma-glutamyl-phosphate reductase [Armatimonadota bacterium]|nr:N-acetyl-gamma-glutamyl-phosphate reductase [bacterium]
MVRVGIIGASGYAGGELVRYLLMHPKVEITYLASGTYEGRPLSDAYPSFLGQNLPLCEKYDAKHALEKADFFFQAQGNGIGMKVAPELISNGRKLIDIPADFRLKDLNQHKKFYAMNHTAPELVAESVYAISELHPKEIAKARLVANPGCYATSAILALAPLMKQKQICLGSVIVDSKSGVSGAGRSKLEVSGLFCEVNEGIKAYGVTTHRHTPEIEQELTLLAGEQVTLNFTPHLIPMNRGILSTAYASAGQGKTLPSASEMVELYKEFYAGKPFMQVLDCGKQPCTKNVLGTNFCHIGVVVDERTNRIIVTCAIDNMGKGAAGQAVQNMNLMLGFDETTGLMSPAVYP